MHVDGRTAGYEDVWIYITYIYIFIYLFIYLIYLFVYLFTKVHMYVCACVCVPLCLSLRVRASERERARERSCCVCGPPSLMVSGLTPFSCLSCLFIHFIMHRGVKVVCGGGGVWPRKEALLHTPDKRTCTFPALDGFWFSRERLETGSEGHPPILCYLALHHRQGSTSSSLSSSNLQMMENTTHIYPMFHRLMGTRTKFGITIIIIISSNNNTSCKGASGSTRLAAHCPQPRL